MNNPNYRLLRVPFLLLAVFLFPAQTIAQITIAPTSLFMDDQSRFGTMMVLNGSEQAYEVSIGFQFGYLGADNEGNSVMIYDDEQAKENYSIADRIRGFPRSFTLQPGQRQVVRLAVMNTAAFSDGTYWTRVKITSNPLSPPLESQAEQGVTAQINFRFEQVTSAFFKKGDVTTGLEIQNLNVYTENGRGYISSNIRQTGNSPYIGRVHIRILNQSGTVQLERRQSVALYFDNIRRFEFDASQLPPGQYTAQLTFETRRNDMSISDLVQAEPVTKQLTFRIR